MFDQTHAQRPMCVVLSVSKLTSFCLPDRRGVAFVDFSSVEGATNAMESLRGSIMIDNQEIRIEYRSDPFAWHANRVCFRMPAGHQTSHRSQSSVHTTALSCFRFKLLRACLHFKNPSVANVCPRNSKSVNCVDFPSFWVVFYLVYFFPKSSVFCCVLACLVGHVPFTHLHTSDVWVITHDVRTRLTFV